MSDTEVHIGKIRKAATFTKEGAIAWLKSRCIVLNKPIDSNDLDKILDHYLWLSDKEFYFNVPDMTLYEILEHKRYEDGDDLYEINHIGDNVLAYVYSFYNGATCFREVMEESLERFNKRNNEI